MRPTYLADLLGGNDPLCGAEHPQAGWVRCVLPVGHARPHLAGALFTNAEKDLPIEWTGAS